jgi:hypothetical protein
MGLYGDDVFSEQTDYWIFEGDEEIHVRMDVQLKYSWEVDEGRVYYSYDVPTEPIIAKADDGREFILSGDSLKEFWEWMRTESDFSDRAPFRESSEWEADFDPPDEYEREYSEREYNFAAAEYFHPSGR